MYMLRQSYINGQGGFEDIYTYGYSPSITVRCLQKFLLGAGRKFDFFLYWDITSAVSPRRVVHIFSQDTVFAVKSS